MQKSRRKADIRARAAAELGKLARAAAEQAAFKQPRPQSWHDVFLHALAQGATLEAAASEAGVTRAGVRYACQHNPRFNDAYQQAYGGSLQRRWQRSQERIATNRLTMRSTGLTTGLSQ